jgi:uncharacterized protein involved in exopolysaccharide biosynthesis
MRAPRNILLLMFFAWLYLFAVGPTTEDRNPQLSPGVTSVTDESATPNAKAAPTKPAPPVSIQPPPAPAAPIQQPPPSNGEGLHSATSAPDNANKASALTALQHAAEQGQLAAQWKLGRMYADGDGVPRDDLRAFNYFTQIVEDWLKGRRSTPNTMAAQTTPAPPVSTQPPPASTQPPPAQPHHLSSCGDDLANSDFAASKSALQTVVAERIHAQEMWERANNSKEIGLPEDLEVGAIKASRTQRAVLMANYQNKLSTFKPDYPDMLRLKAQINQIDQEIKSEAHVIKQSLKAHYESTLQQEALLKNKMDDVKRGVLATRNKEIQYNILKREADNNRTLYEGLLRQYKAMGVAGAVSTNNVAVVNRAQVNLRWNLVKWLGFGLLAAGLAIALFELVDDTFKSPEEIVQNVRVWLIPTFCTVSLAIGFITTFTTTPIYRATVTIQIDRQEPRIVKTDADPGFQNDTYRFYESQYELLKSRMLVERVVSDLNLVSAPDFLNPPSTSPWRKLRSLILPSGKSGDAATEDKRETSDLEQRKAAAAGMVQAGLSIDSVRDSNLVRISFDSSSSDWAARIANGVADTYVTSNLERRYSATAYARNFLKERLDELKLKLEESKKALVACSSD